MLSFLRLSVQTAPLVNCERGLRRNDGSTRSQRKAKRSEPECRGLRSFSNSSASAVASALDRRLPPPGTYLEREYKGRRIIVKILPDGFEFDGHIYRSLSAIASEVAGTKWNGYLFFNFTCAEEKPYAKE